MNNKWVAVGLLVLLVLTCAMGLKSMTTHSMLAVTGAPVPPTPWMAGVTGAPVPPTPWMVTGAPVPPTPWN
jgi:hypothetical protein